MGPHDILCQGLIKQAGAKILKGIPFKNYLSKGDPFGTIYYRGLFYTYNTPG